MVLGSGYSKGNIGYKKFYIFFQKSIFFLAICVHVNTDKDSIIDMSVKFLYQIKYKGRVLLYTALLRQYKGLFKLGSCEESLKNCDFYAIRGGAGGGL